MTSRRVWVGVAGACALAIVFLLRSPPRVLSVSAPPPRVESAPASEEAAPNLVFGRVLSDGAPAAGASVTLHHKIALEDHSCDVCQFTLLDCSDVRSGERLLSQLRDLKDVELARTTTDADGRFAFPDHFTGEFHARAERAALAVDGTVASGVEAELALTTPASAIVRIMNEDDEPVRGASVAMFERERRRFHEDTTNAKGEVHVPGRVPLWIFVRASGYAPLLETDTYFEDENAMTILRPRTLVVKTRSMGEPVDARVQLALYHGHPVRGQSLGGVWRVEELFETSMTVTAETDTLQSSPFFAELDAPETTIEIDLRATGRLVVSVTDGADEPVANAAVTLGSVGSGAEVATNAAGVAIFPPVAEGTYEITVDKENMRSTQRTIDLRPGDNAVTVTLRGMSAIRGKVMLASGAPADGAIVAALGSTSLMTSTTEDGAFELLTPDPGRYTLEATLPKEGRVVAEVSAPVDDVVLTLETRAGLEVRVFGPDGPVPNAGVQISQGESRRFAADGNADEGGVFLVRGLEPGVVKVRVFADALRERYFDAVTVKRDATTTLTVTLDAGVTVSGVTVDESGAPIDFVSVQTDPLTIGALSEGGGRFALPLLDPAVEYTLSVGADLHVLKQPVRVRGETNDLRLILSPKPSVRGRVVDAAGAPLHDLTIDGRYTRSPDGRFTAPVASIEEPIALQIEVPGYESRVISGPYASDLGDVRLDAVMKIEGVVEDANGRPVSGAIVTCAECTPSEDTTSNGRFSVSAQSSSTSYDLVATRGSSRGTATTAGSFTRITLRPGTIIDGRVIGADGRGSVATVIARNRRGEVREIDTTSDGRFRLELVEDEWSFITRLASAPVLVRVRGERVEVELRTNADACDLVLRLPNQVEEAWLLSGDVTLPEDDAAIDTWGAISITDPGVDDQPWRAFGLACNRAYLLLLSLDGKRAAQRIMVDARVTERTIQP